MKTDPVKLLETFRAKQSVEKNLRKLHRWLGADVEREQLEVLVELVALVLKGCEPSLEVTTWKNELEDLKRIVTKRPTLRRIK